MKKLQELLMPKKILSLAIGLLMIIASILMVIFPEVDAFHPMLSWGAFVCLLAGGIGTIALTLFFDGRFAGLAAAPCSAVAFAFFLSKSFMYIADAAYGVDAQWEAVYFIVVIPMLVSLLGGAVSFFLNNPVKKIGPKVLAICGVILFPLLLVGGNIADAYAKQINVTLKIASSKIEKIDGAEDQDTDYFKSKYANIPDLLKAGGEMCEAAEAEGAVLLKNQNEALPLGTGKKVSLFSTNLGNPAYAGTGSGSVDTSTAPTLKSSLEADNRFSVNPGLWEYYVNGDGAAYRSTTGSTGRGVKGAKSIGEAPWAEVEAANGASFAQYGDAAIVLFSRIGGEGSDEPRSTYSLSKMDDSDGTGGDTVNGEYLRLSPKEQALLLGLKAKKEAGVFSRVIVLLNFANQVQADFLKDDSFGVDAAIWVGTVGSTGFNAIAKILSGEVNPSGKLSATFWADHHQNPALSNMGPKVYEGSPDGYLAGNVPNPDRSYTVYQEGIYLGYRYTESRYEDYVANAANVGAFNYDSVVAYPFGYGLSYTNFSYSNFKVEKQGTKAKTVYNVSVDVKNNGTLPGKDVVQVYLDKPYADYNKEKGIEASASELVGFAKTKLLERNETQTITVSVPLRSFASYDYANAGTYVITPGDYYLSIGNGAHDALNNTLRAKGFTPANTSDRMDAEGNADLVSEAIALTLDETTFSTHENTGEKIKNLFADVDYNNYWNKVEGDKVTYISRLNWASTVKTDWGSHVVLHYNDKLQEDLDVYGKESTCVLPEDNSAYPTMGANDGLQLISLRVDSDGNKIPYDDPLWDSFLDQLTWEEMVEVIRKGMRSSDGIASVGKPYTVDHNGPLGVTERFSYGEGLVEGLDTGLVWRYYDAKADAEILKLRPTCYPASGIVASTFNIDLAYDVGDAIGEDCLWVGYSGLYGPGSNIQRTPYSGRNFEYYSEDPFLSGFICGHECSAIESHGVYVYNKHFALNETEDNRRGIQTWANEQTIREIYLRAFEIPMNMEGKEFVHNGQSITLIGASGVMTAFNRMGLYWTGLRKDLMTDYLRKEVGMKGIAVTDMWAGDATPYLNLPAMLVAGTNLVDGSRKATDLEMCKSGHADVAWAMRESLHRICYSVVHSNRMNGLSSNVRIVHIREWWRNVILGAQIATGAMIAGGIAWGILSLLNRRKQEPQVSD